jgi:hypothetical protein
MPALLIIRAALVLLVLLSTVAHTAQTVPVVYEDEYVSIHAGVAEIGLRPIHIGDEISFVMQLEFDADQVRVEMLNRDFFLRAFESQQSFRLYAPPVVTRSGEDDLHFVVDASWPFQILGCPDDLANCPGDKNYELPIISISYQIIDDAGQAVNDKSARFRPSPGSITVASALADPDGPAYEFGNYFPGGAHPEALISGDRQGTTIFAMLAGILVLVAAFNNKEARQQIARHMQLTSDFDRFFADLINRESIGAELRDEYLGRFVQLTENDR